MITVTVGQGIGDRQHFDFKAGTNWSIDDDGRLAIVDEKGTEVAVFNTGCWFSVDRRDDARAVKAA